MNMTEEKKLKVDEAEITELMDYYEEPPSMPFTCYHCGKVDNACKCVCSVCKEGGVMIVQGNPPICLECAENEAESQRLEYEEWKWAKEHPGKSREEYEYEQALLRKYGEY
jgi:hypothetical protein